MNTLHVATDGLLCSPLSQATSGYLCVIVITVPITGGGMRYARSQIIKLGEKITREQLLRDDEEILLMIIATAVAENH